MRHHRTHANEATIEKALEGDYRTEHLFALKQSLEALDHYQKQIVECDPQIAQPIRILETKAESSRSLKAVGGNKSEEIRWHSMSETKRFESAAWIGPSFLDAPKEKSQVVNTK